MKSGFTLLELVAAMAAASILSLTALTCYSQFLKNVIHLRSDYQKDSALMLQNLRCAVPFQNGCGESIRDKQKNNR